MTVTRPEDPEAIPLLEREAELAAGARAVEALCAGESSGGLLIYSGEAGLGKTALLNELRRSAAGRCTVWSARGGEAVTSVPFHVVRQLLQPALNEHAPCDVRELLGDWYEIVGPALGVAPPSGQLADPQGVRDGLDAVVVKLAGMHRPLVLVVDDAHWADLETLAWLAAFARRPDGLPVLIVVAHRTEDPVGETAEHLSTLGEAAGNRSTLRAFTPDATATLARAALGEHSDDPFCREVWAVTGGNPYETVELLAKVQDDSLEPVEDSASALRAIGAGARGSGLIARLEELGTGATRFAWAAAILGTDISLDLAAALAGMGPAEAGACAQRLRAARILVGQDPMEFVHPLIAGGVYRAIPAGVRTAMHGRAAWAVSRAGRPAAAAAPHLLQVHPDQDPELVEQLRAAAAEHLAVGAPDAARRCLERALEEPPLTDVRAEVLYELGCATLLTSPATTVGHLRDALALPGLEGDLRVDAVFRLSQALAHNNEMREAARVVAAEAERTPEGPARIRLQTAHFLWESVQAVEDDGPGRSRRLAATADRLSGRDTSERVLLMLRAWDATNRGESAVEIVQICDRALVNGGLAPGLGWTDPAWGFEPLAMLGLSYAFADRLDRAESLFAEALRSYEISGWSGGHLSFANCFVGYVMRRRGRLVEAETYVRESLRLAERVGNGLPMNWDAACMLIDILLARGHVEEAQEAADSYGFVPPYPSTIVIPDAPSVRGRLLLAQGRTKEAVAELEAVGEALKERGRHNGILAPWACDLARALADEDPLRAAELASYARDRAERFGTDTAIGEALRCAAALEEGPRAVELLRGAVAYLEASPCAYEHALARVEYGIAARSAAELTRGLTLAEACGADGLAERARIALS
ncbi:ATP-binding protein [Streptomyces sp. NBC_01465]|uniref:ATP-binding protein n=1 Tax=Streptomyces sp. NBC_01465 TaxID=2903878 RepID=UPI002E2F7B7E|nr:AAA family ATPase [Streptomyces sp. NBC_01465]